MYLHPAGDSIFFILICVPACYEMLDNQGIYVC